VGLWGLPVLRGLPALPAPLARAAEGRGPLDQPGQPGLRGRRELTGRWAIRASRGLPAIPGRWATPAIRGLQATRGLEVTPVRPGPWATPAIRGLQASPGREVPPGRPGLWATPATRALPATPDIPGRRGQRVPLELEGRGPLGLQDRPGLWATPAPRGQLGLGGQREIVGRRGRREIVGLRGQRGLWGQLVIMGQPAHPERPEIVGLRGQRGQWEIEEPRGPVGRPGQRARPGHRVPGKWKAATTPTPGSRTRRRVL
jgi:collagen type V/XI/XXIV/XXVII, alpha